MKKVLLAATFALLGCAAKAQTASVEYSADPLVAYPLAVAFIGNNDPMPSCETVVSTASLDPIPIAPATTTMVGAAALPIPVANMANANIDVDMGGGVHYGGLIDLCSLTPGRDYSLSFGGGAFSCHYDVLSVSSTLIQLYFKP